MSIKGKINFLQLARYGDKGEQHYRRQFAERFDFAGLNAELIGACASKHLVLALDPTHLPKSGKKTYGKDFFWSGCAGAVKPGLEFNGLAVVDIDNHTALHLDAQQTPTHEYLKLNGLTQFDWYLSLVGQAVKKHPNLSDYLCADAFFSREPFVEMPFRLHHIRNMRQPPLQTPEHLQCRLPDINRQPINHPTNHPNMITMVVRNKQRTPRNIPA